MLKARKSGTEAKTKNSPMARQAAKIAEQDRQIEHLTEAIAAVRTKIAGVQELLAAAERDGSLFDLRKDSIKDIAATIIANVTPGRAEGLAREILHQFKNKKTPAG